MQREKIAQKQGADSVKRKKKALGKGLGALIPDLGSAEEKSGDYFYCDIDLIRPNRYQPRIQFPENELQELSQSIREQGILQPLLVRKENGGYELIAGERRLRAAKKVGLTQVPVVVKHISDSKLLEISIVENIQRENFNPIEEAEAYYRLVTEFNLTQDQAANRVGKSRSAIANFLRLRQLPEPIKTSISDGSLSMGHARALLGIDAAGGQIAAWRAVLSKGLSVRQTEQLIRRLKGTRKKAPARPKSATENYFRDLADELSRHFGTKVIIKKTGSRGRVEIEFYSDDDLDRLIGLLQQR